MIENKTYAESNYTDKVIPLAKSSITTTENQENGKRCEGRTIILATIVLLPLAAATLVGAYGFIIWFSQRILA